VRVLALCAMLVLTACGPTGAAAKPTPTPSPFPSPTPNVGKLYLAAINTIHDSRVIDDTAFYNSKPGSAEESAAATTLADDYQTLLVALDAIPFPVDAKDDVSALKKSAVALQIFWSGVATSTNNYNRFTDNSLGNAYAQAALVLGHDVGITLVITGPSPSPT
jgi:hypothetical protein